MKKLTKFLTVLAFAVFLTALITLTATAATVIKSGSCGDNNVTYTLDSDGVLTIYGGGAMKNYTAYSTVPWYSNRASVKKVVILNGVTSISNWAFYECDSLTSVTIPDSVTSIGQYAFDDCTDLTSVTFGNSVTSIGEYAFLYCDSLTTITIPDSVTSIGKYAFYDCDSLTGITIPDSVTIIGSGAFYDTGYYNNSSNWENDALYIGNHLIEVNTTILGAYAIKNGTKTIAGDAFSGCTGLTSITIPDSVTSIGEYAFSGCTSLESVTIPDSVTSIGNWAFQNCTSLESVTIPDSVTSIDKYAFYGCTSLTSVTIPSSVKYIGSYAFYNCTSLESVTIPSSVTKISQKAFYKCTSLTSVTIPSSVTSIDKYAFGYYYFSGYTNGYEKRIDGFTIYGYTGSAAETYANDNGITFVALEKHYIEGTEIWWTFNEKTGTLTIGGEGAIPDYVRNTNNAPWYAGNNKTVTAIVVEDGITAIGNYAFYNLSKATTMTVAESVKYVGIQFIRGTAITEVSLPGVEIIAGNAFGAADSLAKIILSEKVYDIYGNMFYANTVTVVAPEGSYVDYYLRMYTEVFGTKATPTFEANGTATRKILDFAKVGQTAFYTLYEDSADSWTMVYSGSDKMTNFAYYSPKNVAKGLAFSPARNLFQDGNKCVYINNVILGDALNNLGNYALEMCTKVKTVELGDKMIRIGRDAFRSVAIKSLVIPEGVVLIDNQAFANCNALSSLTIPSTITADDPNAMSYDKMGLGFDLFLKCKPATVEGYYPSLVVTTENRVVIDYLINNYPLVAKNSGFTK